MKAPWICHYCDNRNYYSKNPDECATCGGKRKKNEETKRSPQQIKQEKADENLAASIAFQPPVLKENEWSC